MRNLLKIKKIACFFLHNENIHGGGRLTAPPRPPTAKLHTLTLPLETQSYN